MIQINQLKVESTNDNSDLKPYIAKFLRLAEQEIVSYRILKKSIDARKKPMIFYVYSVAVTIAAKEEQILQRNKKNVNVTPYQEVKYHFPVTEEHIEMKNRPIVIGAGPAGLFCAYILAQAGYAPIVLERGKKVEERQKDVLSFWNTGYFSKESNVQFGEGGAGTFSDGKLNTLVKDKSGRNAYVLETFVKFGASEQILWDAKPHIGTDVLMTVVKNMREEIIRLGGSFCFETKVCDFVFDDNVCNGVVTDEKQWNAQVCVLAIGHSARDTFRKLYERKVPMHAKEFAVGFRIEHPQNLIDISQYGESHDKQLPVSPYKLATKLENGRGVYSFCMCPGGYVVNASSEENRLVVNGMSYSKRDSANANSAIVVSVGSQEYNLNDPMGAIRYQISLEEKAFSMGNGLIPQQLYGDYLQKQRSSAYGTFTSETKGKTCFAPLHELFSEDVNTSFQAGMELFGHKIKGFDREDAILSGVESRTSSPVRIERDTFFESEIKGLYPCGEGAGYAGGIMSAAMDGMKVAEQIIKKYKVQYE